ncbi:MAG TPA: hypothetical protein P5244_07940 [Syntrophales bacterium]|nr:hypothetical protein [Syntrophales bacterium]
MSKQGEVFDVAMRESTPAPLDIGTDDVLAIAAQAKARVAAVREIKSSVLAMTDPSDWTDQDGKPYLQASGGEKIAIAFGINWRFLTPEPLKIEDQDGHYTYEYTMEFTMGSRCIQITGSRSSKDPFFKQYRYEGEGQNRKRIELAVHERNNERDVKMAAYTNAVGNGVSRILGFRGITWEDLWEYAKIKREDVIGIQYKKKGEAPNGTQRPTYRAPQRRSAGQDVPPAPAKGDEHPDGKASENQLKAIRKLYADLGVTSEDAILTNTRVAVGSHDLAKIEDLSDDYAGGLIHFLQEKLDEKKRAGK